MAENEGFWSQLKSDPAVQALLSNAGQYATARAGKTVEGATQRLSGEGGGGDTPASSDEDEGGDGDGGGLGQRMKKGAAGGALKGAFQAVFKRGKKGGAAKRPTNIMETAWVGVPVQTAFNEWTQYDKFANYMKGPEKADVRQEGDTLVSSWTAKIFINRRTWKSTVLDQDPDERIKWKSEGNKGVVDGVVVFTPVGENLTHILLILEYRSKGPIEWIGNRWRTVGRRARLDLKHYVRHVTMAGEESGSWRGTVEDGKVIETDEDAQQREQEEREQEEREQAEQDASEQEQGDEGADDEQRRDDGDGDGGGDSGDGGGDWGPDDGGEPEADEEPVEEEPEPEPEPVRQRARN